MKLPERSGDKLRIGVAITIPEPYSTVLQAARGRFGDPWADFIPPHITLLGPTVVDPDEIEAVDEHLSSVAASHRPFLVHLRGTETFRPVSPVVFVQLVEGSSGCAALERSVRSHVLEQELRFDYHPHVTVAHEVADEQLDSAYAELAGFDASFLVDSFHSYAHGDDGVWRPVRDFSLTGAAADAGVVSPT
ncbi:2'-5' RNA ligase family protein [Cellulomonas sp. McL0617]|uniref:2'-5' RNA ligase family protein n=1 Tax=Cellulomonas sp. McL0617 TaxID=3415675 RepID=UPI003CEA57DA